ncbi:site-2 protease family protein [bacterium]|nr:site-2 protease family protein [bacterium]
MFIFLAIIALSILIFFHETGHFLMAKIFKVKVEEFGIGYPPRMGGFVFKGRKPKFFWGRKSPALTSNQTVYSLNWIPLGGFTKLKGEMNTLPEKDSFSAQVWWKKVLVSAGGVIMNIFLAVAIFSFLCLIGIPRDLSQENLATGKIISPIVIQVSGVFPNSPASEANLQVGDILLDIDGKEFTEVTEIQNYIQGKIGKSIKIKTERGQEIIAQELSVLPYQDIFKDEGNLEENVLDKGFIGVSLSKTALVRYPWYQAMLKGWSMTFYLLGQMFYGIGLIFKTLIFKHKMIGGVLGPIGITQMISSVARVSFIYLLHFVAIISVAIGAFQLIPFPALDGSRIVFALFEGLRGRPLNQRVEMVATSIGFYLLLFLMAVVSFREIVNLF